MLVIRNPPQSSTGFDLGPEALEAFTPPPPEAVGKSEDTLKASTTDPRIPSSPERQPKTRSRRLGFRVYCGCRVRVPDFRLDAAVLPSGCDAPGSGTRPSEAAQGLGFRGSGV